VPDDFRLTHVAWRQGWRIVPSRFPSINLFEDLTNDPAEWELLAEIEAAVNPRVRDDLGEIRLVSPEMRVASTIVMAPFIHLNPLGSRFSDGGYGVYYAGDRLETAIRETVYHLEVRLGAGHAAPDDLDQRGYVGEIEGDFIDLTRNPNEAAPLLHPTDYGASRRFGAEARKAGRDGIHYESVRHPAGRALAVFVPPRVSPPRQERHLRYDWDGTRIRRYFDYSTEQWIGL
jgi:hypothetical protein